MKRTLTRGANVFLSTIIITKSSIFLFLISASIKPSMVKITSDFAILQWPAAGTVIQKYSNTIHDTRCKNMETILGLSPMSLIKPAPKIDKLAPIKSSPQKWKKLAPNFNQSVSLPQKYHLRWR